MNHYFLSAFLCFLTGLLSALFVFIKDHTHSLNRVFILLCSFFAIYGISFALLCISKQERLALFLGKITMSSAIFYTLCYFHLAMLALEKSLSPLGVISLYLIGLTFALINFPTQLILTNPRPSHGLSLMNRAGSLYPYTVFMFFGIAGYAGYKLYKGIKQSTGSKRNQLKYLLLAPIVAAIGGGTNYIIAYDFAIPIINPFGGYLTLLFPLIIAIAVFKYRLFDINIAIRKITLYSLLIALLFMASVTALFLASRAFGKFFPHQTIWSTFFIITFLALIFQPLYRWINSRIDRLFFKGTLPDVSAEKTRLEEELHRSERLAAIGMLASGLLHEMKNSLVPIRAQVELLPKHKGDDKFIGKLTTTIPQEVDRITGLLGQLKEFANPTDLKIEQVDLTKILDDRLTFLKDTFTQRKIQVNKHYNSTDSTISGDPGKLSQVFSNLFDNAVGAMPQGGVLTVLCKQSTMPGRDKPAVLVRVHDTGFGISKEDLTKIFDPFFTKKTHGTGLGLAVSHQIIKNHGGMILVESEVRKGTTFEVFLPK